MRVLIAEDDLISRKFLFKFLSKYGDCDIVVDGLEALDAYLLAIKDNKPYDLICLDIMMPRVDGVKVLKSIRDFETQRGLMPEKRSRVIMTTALAETRFVQKAYDIGCDAYAAKPIDIAKLDEILLKLGLVQGTS
jgi:two-component system chemotaxis response regulator CheY